MAQLLKIHPDNPQERLIKIVAECLHDGGVVIYPTDTVYGIGCNINKTKAVERICKIKGIVPEKSNFSLIFTDLSHLSEYAKHVSNPAFKLLKKSLPGPYTFILEASNQVPKIFKHKKNTIGIRIPNNRICMELVHSTGCPIMNTSVHSDDGITSHFSEPDEIYEYYKHQVDLIIDGGAGSLLPSTVISCVNDDFVVLREGAGEPLF